MHIAKLAMQGYNKVNTKRCICFGNDCLHMIQNAMMHEHGIDMKWMLLLSSCWFEADPKPLMKLVEKKALSVYMSSQKVRP